MEPYAHFLVWSLQTFRVWSLFNLEIWCVNATYIKNFQKNFSFTSAFKIVLVISISSLHCFYQTLLNFQSFVFYFSRQNLDFAFLKNQFDKIKVFYHKLEIIFYCERFSWSIRSDLSVQDRCSREKIKRDVQLQSYFYCMDHSLQATLKDILEAWKSVCTIV